MNSDTHLYEIISAYLENRLSPEGRKQFESDMDNDPDLKQLVNDFPLMEEALQAAISEKEFENIIQEEGLKTLHKISASGLTLNTEDPKRVISIFSNQWIKYAAAIILTLIIGAYPIYSTFYKQSPEQLYQDFYAGYPNVEISTTRGSTSDNILPLRMEAYNHYDNQEFQRFIQAIDELPTDYPDKLNDHFYLGIAYLETKQWENAVDIFEQLANSNSNYQAEIDWFLGMAYLGIGACEKAKSTLEKVQINGPDNKEKASTILKRIRC